MSAKKIIRRVLVFGTLLYTLGLFPLVYFTPQHDIPNLLPFLFKSAAVCFGIVFFCTYFLPYEGPKDETSEF